MSNAAAARRTPDDAPLDPMIVVRTRADALYRSAVECCRQHDRSAKVLSSPDDPELEHKHLEAICKMCDGSLLEMAEAYARAAGNVQPARDEAWWHKANALWHASREYARRHAGCDDISRRISGKHDSQQLGAVQLEYELEASSLLALRHAADAYHKTRAELK